MRRPLALVAGCVAVLAGVAAASPAVNTATTCVPRWRVMASGMNVSNLADISAVSATDVWAIGNQPRGSSDYEPVVLHWNGQRWSEVDFPVTEAGTYLRTVEAVSARDVWVAGDAPFAPRSSAPLLEHWTGSSWETEPAQWPRTRFNQIWALAALSSTDVWAVGNSQPAGGDVGALIEHWGGRAWKPALGRQEGGVRLLGVSAASRRSVWAVGLQGLVEHAPEGALDSFSERWNGQRWQTIPTPRRGFEDDALWDVDSVSSREAWAVGESGGGSLVLHWTGRRWQREAKGLQRGELRAVAALGPGDVWVGGARGLAHWNGHQARSPGINRAVAAFSILTSKDIWAAGPRLLARYSC